MKTLVYLILGILLLAGCTVPVSDNSTTNETGLFTPGVEPTDENLPTKSFKEGEVVQFKQDVAYDPDGDQLSYSFSAPLDKNGKWETEIGDAGTYIVTVTVSDGKLESTQKVKLIIEAVNRRPIVDNFKDVKVKEGETIELNPDVTDEDGDDVTLSYSGFMTSNTYTATFEDAGEYEVTLTADDGKQTTSETITVTIEDVNRAPTVDLSSVEDVSVFAGETITVNAVASDPDGDAISVEYGKPLDENGVWVTTEEDAGTYDIDVTVSDGDETTKESFKVTLIARNKVPVIDIDDSLSFDEGDLIELNPGISDEDGDELTVTYSGFMTSSSYQTTFDDAGTYTVTITATDGMDETVKDVEIVVEDVNRAPTFTGDLFN